MKRALGCALVVVLAWGCSRKRAPRPEHRDAGVVRQGVDAVVSRPETGVSDAGMTVAAMDARVVLDAARPRAQLVFAQGERIYGERWADPWDVTLEVPRATGAPRVYAVGSVTLSSAPDEPCIVAREVTSQTELHFPVGGGSFEVNVTLRDRRIAWEFVEQAEGDDPRAAGTTERKHGRVQLPPGVADDGFEVLCREQATSDAGAP